ncbi:MAG TPA: SRPBCC family protein [Solirubrobacteraceae bacterium]|nr:SRPBCC family protein [Solirubrobacteraceae bacterium]
MRFENEIEVARSPKELFAFLTDVERVAPCLPGASIDGRDGDAYQGSMKVKVGPITGTYRGTMRFLEQDEDALRAVMSARAAEVNGQGDAEAKITTQIEQAGQDASRIRMETDLQMRGRVAQFGRGAMAKISQRMFDEFARNLEREMAGGDGAAEEAEPERQPEAAAEPEPERAKRSEPRPPAPAAAREPEGEAQALDAMSLFVTPALKKVLPVLGPALIGLGYGYLLGRLRELRR